jgi:hypothetical protein
MLVIMSLRQQVLEEQGTQLGAGNTVRSLTV